MCSLALAASLGVVAVLAPATGGRPTDDHDPALYSNTAPAAAFIAEDPHLMPHRRATPAPPPAPVAAPPAAAANRSVKPATVRVASPAWVHPLTSGKKAGSCYRTARRPSHGGVDIAQPAGTPIRAASAGQIHRKAYQGGGAGHYVVVRHAGGIYTRYMHLRAASPLRVGASVRAGQTIGYVGRTGNATGHHLHFEVLRGGESNSNRINPAPFMRARGINVGCLA